jgi:tetratricopeptide (TPR) repeat protein
MRLSKFYFFYAFILFFGPVISIGQASLIDSLRNELSKKAGSENYKICLELSEFYMELHLDSAFKYAELALIEGEFLNKDTIIAIALEKMALSHFYNNRKEQAIPLFRRESEIWTRLGHSINQSRAIIDIGLSYSQMGKLDSALSYYKVALEIYRRTNDIWGQVMALNKIAITQQRFGNYKLALEYNMTALELSELNDLKDKEGGTCNDIGILYRKISQPQMALTYFNRAIGIFIELNDHGKLGSLYNNVGTVYYMEGKKDSALVYFEKSLESNLQQKNWVFVSQILSNISQTFSELGNTTQALNYANRALDINKQYGFHTHLISTYYALGLLYTENREFENAEEYYNLSLDLAKELKIRSKIPNTYFALHKLFVAKDDYKSALKYYQLYSNISDSLLTEKSKNEIAEINTRYETEKTRKENETLKLKQEKDRSSRLFLMVVAAFLIITVVLLVILIVFRTKVSGRNREFYEKEKKLNAVLVESAEEEKNHFEEIIFAEKKINELQKEKIIGKNRELTTLLISVSSRNKILEEMKTRIDDIRSKGSYDLYDLDLLQNIINGKQTIEEDWRIFSAQIEEVYPGFFNKLQMRCPELTQYDLKLCSYLLIDLSTKEIAEMMYVSDAAIVKQRQRVRKKLDIENNDEFLLFLRQI